MGPAPPHGMGYRGEFARYQLRIRERWKLLGLLLGCGVTTKVTGLVTVLLLPDTRRVATGARQCGNSRGTCCDLPFREDSNGDKPLPPSPAAASDTACRGFMGVPPGRVTAAPHKVPLPRISSENLSENGPSSVMDLLRRRGASYRKITPTPSCETLRLAPAPSSSSCDAASRRINPLCPGARGCFKRKRAPSQSIPESYDSTAAQLQPPAPGPPGPSLGNTDGAPEPGDSVRFQYLLARHHYVTEFPAASEVFQSSTARTMRTAELISRLLNPSLNASRK